MLWNGKGVFALVNFTHQVHSNAFILLIITCHEVCFMRWNQGPPVEDHMSFGTAKQ